MANKWQSFLESEDLPQNFIAHVRIADNVLDEEDWTIDEIIVVNGAVFEQKRMYRGVYDLENMVGWSKTAIAEWTRYDGTGNYPEEYHDIQILTMEA